MPELYCKKVFFATFFFTLPSPPRYMCWGSNQKWNTDVTCHKKKKNHPDWFGTEWKIPTGRKLSPQGSPNRRHCQGRCKSAVPGFAMLSSMENNLGNPCMPLPTQWDSQMQKNPCWWYYSWPLGDRKGYVAGSSGQSINCLVYKALVFCLSYMVGM